MNNDTFCRLPVTSAQCVVGTAKYTDAGILLIYDDDEYSQGHGQTKEAFRDWTKGDILQPFISDYDFRPSNVRVDDVGYKFYALDIKYHKFSQLPNELK